MSYSSDPAISSFDYIVIGAGIIGLTIARRLALKGYRNICILEKEPQLGVHTSGRNSGVLHAGIYYGSDTLKAKVCTRGSELMQEYARARGISLLKTGKVIVALSEEEQTQLLRLLDQARENGVQVEKIDRQQLREIEPEARTLESAIFSPNTAVIDSRTVLEKLEEELTGLGVKILKSEKVVRISVQEKQIQTQKNIYHFGHLINAAGLFADRIAHQLGVAKNLHILPFKGIYRKLTPEAAQLFKGSIYPVPDLRMPFLGVHITRNVHGDVYLGPTAIPAFGRENYGLLQGMSLVESPLMFRTLTTMIARNQNGMRNLVQEELQKYSKMGLLRSAQRLAPILRREQLQNSLKVGLRAQLVDTTTMTLMMDFKILAGPHSTHVLNAISPGFTSSFAFSEWIVDQVEQNQKLGS